MTLPTTYRVHAESLSGHARTFAAEERPPIDPDDLDGSMRRSHEWYCQQWGGARWLLGEMADTIDTLLSRIAELETTEETDDPATE